MVKAEQKVNLGSDQASQASFIDVGDIDGDDIRDLVVNGANLQGEMRIETMQ